MKKYAALRVEYTNGETDIRILEAVESDGEYCHGRSVKTGTVWSFPQHVYNEQLEFETDSEEALKVKYFEEFL